ncbi:hypothetical protein [Clostridium drakei]|nr:hypothetical protein [Clostridium drakei]
MEDTINPTITVDANKIKYEGVKLNYTFKRPPGFQKNPLTYSDFRNRNYK